MFAQARRGLGTLVLLALAGAVVVSVVGLLAGSGGYYLMAADLREGHPLHASLRPGGPVGLLLGVAGTTLMLVMLSYSVRKRVRGAAWLGRPVWWLRLHILCGVSGPILIALHAGLTLPSGLVAVAFWCMVLVALSGAFGRYVFGHLPRTAEGRRMSLRATREAASDLRARLVAETREARLEQVGEAVALARDLDTRVGSPLGLVALDLEVRRRRRRIRDLLQGAGLAPVMRDQATRTLVAQLDTRRSLEAWEVSRRLFRYWHLFHEPLAEAMYLIVAVHVVTALLFGGALFTLLGLWGGG